MKLLTRATTVFDRIIGRAALLAAILIIFIMLAVDTDIVWALVSKKSIIWIIEVTMFCLLYICFLSAAWLLKMDRHVKMDLVLVRLKPRAQAIVNIITSILGILICLVLIWWGIDVTLEQFRGGFFIPSTIHYPRWPLIAIIPVGSFLLLIQFLRTTHGYIKEWEAALDKDQSRQ